MPGLGTLKKGVSPQYQRTEMEVSSLSAGGKGVGWGVGGTGPLGSLQATRATAKATGVGPVINSSINS